LVVISAGSGCGIKRKEVGKKGTGIFPGPDIFPAAKRKNRNFFGRENFYRPGRSGYFSKKAGSLQKFTPKEKFASQMYIRLSDNYPIIGLLTYSSFSREKENCRIIAGQ
jgi:hypothetical protein